MFPSRVQEIVAGGGGRFLIAKMPSLYSVAVFDVNSLNIVKYIRLRNPRQLVVAGLDTLFIIDPDDRRTEQWSLQTLERLSVVVLPGRGQIHAAAIGAASSGPLLVMSRLSVATSYALQFHAADTLQPIDHYSTRGILLPGMQHNVASEMLASDNGSAFLIPKWDTLIHRAGEIVWKENSGTAQSGWIGLSSSGDCMFRDLEQWEITGSSPMIRHVDSGRSVGIPAVGGPFHLRLSDHAGKDGAVFTGSVYVNDLNTEIGRVAFSAQEESLVDGIRDEGQDIESKRFWMLTEAQLVVRLRRDRRAIQFMPFDAKARLQESKQPFLKIAASRTLDRNSSDGSSTAIDSSVGGTNQSLRMKLVAITNQPAVKWELQSAPAGTSLDDNGQLSWTVPENVSRGIVPVEVNATSGQNTQTKTICFSVTGSEGVSAARLPLYPQGRGPVKSAEPVPENSTEATLALATGDPLQGKPAMVDLMSPASDVSIGGDGRYLVLHLKLRQKLAVIDLANVRLNGFIPLETNDITFSAGRSAVIIVSGEDKTVQRWNLNTLAFEHAASIANIGMTDDVRRNGNNQARRMSIRMGSGADDIAVLQIADQTTSQVFALDAQTLQKVEFPAQPDTYQSHLLFDSSCAMSGDGFELVPFESTAPNHVRVVIRHGLKYETHVCQSAFRSQQQHVDFVRSSNMVAAGKSGIPAAPLLDNYAILRSPSQGPDLQIGESEASSPQPTSAAMNAAPIYLLDRDGRRLCKLKNIEDSRPLAGDTIQQLRSGQIAWFCPQYQLLATLSPARSSVQFWPLETERHLSAIEDLLSVESSAPLRAVPGLKYEYSLRVRSSEQERTFAVETGPEGMEVDATGRIQWSVPDDPGSAENPVVISISTPRGTKIRHTFSVLIFGYEALQQERMRKEQIRMAEIAAENRKTAERRQRLASERARKEHHIVQEFKKNRKAVIAEDLRETANFWNELRDQAIAADEENKPVIPALALPQLRTWKNTNGDEILGTLSGMFGDNVIIRRSSGLEIQIEATTLVEEDRNYIRAFKKNRSVAKEYRQNKDILREKTQGDLTQRRQLRNLSAANMNTISLAMRQGQIGLQGVESPRSRLWQSDRLSWRVHLLPHLGYSRLYARFALDEPWFSKANRQLIPEMPKIYAAPGSQSKAGRTNYLAVRDSLSNLASPIQLVEVSDDRAVTWTRPEDYSVASDCQYLDLFGLRDEGALVNTALVGAADRSTQLLKVELDPEVLRQILTGDERSGTNVESVFLTPDPAAALAEPLNSLLPNPGHVIVPETSPLTVSISLKQLGLHPIWKLAGPWIDEELPAGTPNLKSLDSVAVSFGQYHAITTVSANSEIDWRSSFRRHLGNITPQTQVWPVANFGDKQRPIEFGLSQKGFAVHSQPHLIVTASGGSDSFRVLAPYLVGWADKDSPEWQKLSEESCVELFWRPKYATSLVSSLTLEESERSQLQPLLQRTTAGRLKLTLAESVSFQGQLTLNTPDDAAAVVDACQTLRSILIRKEIARHIKANSPMGKVTSATAVRLLNACRIEPHNDQIQLTSTLDAQTLFEALAGNLQLETAEQKASANQQHRRHKLAEIGQAVRKFQQQQGVLPQSRMPSEATEHTHSWRIAILPFLHDPLAKKIYDDYHFDEAWNSPHNTKSTSQMPDVFRSRDEATGEVAQNTDASTIANNDNSTLTHIMGFHGEAAAFGNDYPLAIENFPDGSNMTVLLIESAETVHWAEPKDIDFEPGANLQHVLGNASSDNELSANRMVVLVDGSVPQLPSTVTAEQLGQLVHRFDARTVRLLPLADVDASDGVAR